MHSLATFLNRRRHRFRADRPRRHFQRGNSSGHYLRPSSNCLNALLEYPIDYEHKIEMSFYESLFDEHILEHEEGRGNFMMGKNTVRRNSNLST